MSSVGSASRLLLVFVMMFVIFIIVGYAIGGLFFNNWLAGTIFFIAIAGLMNAIAYFFSAKIVLWSYHVNRHRSGVA